MKRKKGKKRSFLLPGLKKNLCTPSKIQAIWSASRWTEEDQQGSDENGIRDLFHPSIDQNMTKIFGLVQYRSNSANVPESWKETNKHEQDIYRIINANDIILWTHSTGEVGYHSIHLMLLLLLYIRKRIKLWRTMKISDMKQKFWHVRSHTTNLFESLTRKGSTTNARCKTFGNAPSINRTKSETQDKHWMTSPTSPTCLFYTPTFQ